MVTTPRSGFGRTRSFFRETADLPRYEQHGFISRHVSEKALEAAWRSRVRWHNLRGRPRHSRRVLQWNGHFVLYDLHLPPAAPLPPEIALPVASDAEGGRRRVAAAATGTQEATAAERDEADGGGNVDDRTSACGRGATFRSNGALVSPNGRYTFVQHNDNELVIYDAEGGVIWAPGPEPEHLGEKENKVYTVFQHDGNLVQYAEGKRWKHGRVVLWQAGVAGAGGNRLVMQDDGNLVIYNTRPSAASSDNGGASKGTGSNGGTGSSEGRNARRPSAVIVWESGTGENGGRNRIVVS